MAMKVCMFVYNNMTRDSRVMKEAKTLVEAGYDVRVVAVLDKITNPYQELHGFRIIRVVKKPFHYKIIKLFKGISYIPHWINSLLFDPVARLLYKGLKRAYRSIKPDTDDKEMNGHNRNMTKARSICSCAYCRFVMLVYYVYCFIRRIINYICSGIRNNIKRCNVFLCAKLKGFLMIFHRPLSFVDYYFRSFRLVKMEPADVYHAHDLNTLPVAYWARKKMGGKLVYDSHELFTETSTLSNVERVMAKVTEKYLIRKANNIITVNESIANELSTRYGVIHPTVIMNCPVITDRLNRSKDNLLRQSLGIDKKTPIILYHGGFSPNRGLQNLVKAALHLDQGIIVFMGWGIIERELKDLVKANGVGDKVKFAKPVPQKDLLNYATSANLGIIPYQAVGLNNYYTTPNKLFEYMAAGLPIAGSNFPELIKVIEEYNLGKTFNPNDPEDIAQAINYMLADKIRYEQMKKNAVKASEFFNWENESKKLSEIYKKFEDEFNSTSN